MCHAHPASRDGASAASASCQGGVDRRHRRAACARRRTGRRPRGARRSPCGWGRGSRRSAEPESARRPRRPRGPNRRTRREARWRRTRGAASPPAASRSRTDVPGEALRPRVVEGAGEGRRPDGHCGILRAGSVHDQRRLGGRAGELGPDRGGAGLAAVCHAGRIDRGDGRDRRTGRPRRPPGSPCRPGANAVSRKCWVSPTWTSAVSGRSSSRPIGVQADGDLAGSLDVADARDDAGGAGPHRRHESSVRDRARPFRPRTTRRVRCRLCDRRSPEPSTSPGWTFRPARPEHTTARGTRSALTSTTSTGTWALTLLERGRHRRLAGLLCDDAAARVHVRHAPVRRAPCGERPIRRAGPWLPGSGPIAAAIDRGRRS